MNIMKKAIILLIVVTGMSMFQGCEKFLEEDPKSFSSAANLSNSKPGIEQMLMGIYESGRNFYRNRYYVMMFGITTDELHYPGSNSSRIEMQNFIFTAENSNLRRCWTTNVFCISRANLVLDYLPKDAVDQDFINLIEAEAKFLRAWHYFSQVQAYGNVPLITSSSVEDLFPTNSTVPEIYDVIVEDLLFAEQSLPGWEENPNKGRATRGAAKSLLGKVYLARATSEAAQSGDYQSALTKLQEVIDTEGYGLWDDYNEVFIPSSDNGKEDIYSCQFQAGTRWNNSLHTAFAGEPDIYGLNGYGNFKLSDTLAKSMDPGDERMALVYWGAYQIPGDTTWYQTEEGMAETQKFRDPGNQVRSDHSTNLPFIRYADVLLMAAEAMNELNASPPANALTYLNMVRLRSDILELSGLDKVQMRDAIRDERWKEFYGEGIRWFDLKRWGILKERVEMAKPGVTVNPEKHYVFPFPQQEVDANKNLIQNPGY